MAEQQVQSVRLARTPDVDDIAAVQVAAWRSSYAGVLPASLLDALDPDDLAMAWANAILVPPKGAHRLLVALDGDRLVGYAATAPATDPDARADQEGELVALEVHPEERGRGHGSRLVNAAVDYLRGDGFSAAVAWVPVGTDERRAFLESSGWVADGAHRELAVDGGPATVREVRLVTTFGADEGTADSPRATTV